MIILPATTHDGSTSVATGGRFKGAGYYGRPTALHTAAWQLTGFTGVITLQAALTLDPVEGDWFDVNFDPQEYVTDVTGKITPVASTSVEYLTPTTAFVSRNFNGNFVWVRAAIREWTAGTVNAVYLNQ